MSAQPLTSVVRFVETALAKVHDQTAQETLADQLGYLCHSPISRALSKVRDGKADGLLAVYTARELVLLAMSHGMLADALRTALAGSAFSTGRTAERSLNELGQRFAAEIGEIMADLGDGALDDREIDDRLTALDRLAQCVSQTKSDLLQRKANRSHP